MKSVLTLAAVLAATSLVAPSLAAADPGAAAPGPATPGPAVPAPAAQPAPEPAPAFVPAQPAPAPAPAPVAAPVTRPTVATAQPAEPTVTKTAESDEGWHAPVGKRFMHGFRLGYMTLMNYDRVNRDNNMSLKSELGLKTNHMMLLGYEGFYRIVGHSWLNVLLVGNVTVAGLEQSKFIPAASGLIGVELDHSFQLGVGVNLTPDSQAPSHMIAAAGWTPQVGSISTPIHFFFVPDPDKNHRVGMTVGVTW